MIVVLFDPRRLSLVLVEAIEFFQGKVQYADEMPVAVPRSLLAAWRTTGRCRRNDGQTAYRLFLGK